jgi:protein TonB
MKRMIPLFALSLSLANAHAQVALAPIRQDSAPSVRKDTSDKLLPDGDKTYLKVEIESYFPGGTKGWLQYLGAHVSYPPKAVRKRIEGTVLLQFIVDKDGSVYNLQALSGDPILIEAALKAMKDTPKWIPAVQNGKNVKSYKKQPIVFRLDPK